MNYPCIKGFQPSSLIEWEGHLSAVVYLAGCNFRCPFCQNPGLVGEADDIEAIPLDAIKCSIREQDGWLDAVCITGGEPTLFTSLFELIREIRELGVKIHLETNGSRPEVVKVLVAGGLIDYVALDFKAPLNEKYAAATGHRADINAIGETMDFLLTDLLDYEFRTTVVPTILGKDELLEMARTVPNARRFFIQRYSNLNTLDPAFAGIDPYPDATMREFASAMREYCPVVELRGKPEDRLEDRKTVPSFMGVKRF